MYNGINRKTTIQQAKEFLKGYRIWKIETARFKKWINAPLVSEASKEVVMEDSADQQMSSAASARFECDLRIKTLEQLATLDEESAMYSDRLYYRYINGWTVIKAANKLAIKYERGYIAERTYTNYLHKALWEFAVICPRNLLVSKQG